MEALWIVFAFALGLLFRQFGLPPLVGYLVAGFALKAYDEIYQLGFTDSTALTSLAHAGVLLLLFSVGLKLRLQSILRAEVWATATLHIVLFCLLFASVTVYLITLAWPTAILIALALAFSSTVVAAKVLEAKRELRTFHGRVAIGILIIQDLVALAALSMSGHSPSLYALLLLILPFLRPLLHRLLDFSGHDELLVLYGLMLAIAGGVVFELVGLSAELGALLFGAILAGHRRTQELAHALWSIKEVFLVGFFLMIGMSGIPSIAELGIALVLVLLLPLKAILFFYILICLKLRARSAFLTSLSLASYSEFGLIVANIALPEWVLVLALAVVLSFAIAAPLNRFAHVLYERFEQQLLCFEFNQRHPDEQPISLGRAQILIMGMGRTGTAAYDFLRERAEHLVGLDSDPGKIEAHLQVGRRVLYADAEDPGFWQTVKLDKLKAIVLCMNDPEAKIIATRQLRNKNYTGIIVANSLFEDEAEAIAAAGADLALLAFSEAGVGLAEHVLSAVNQQQNQAVE